MHFLRRARSKTLSKRGQVKKGRRRINKNKNVRGIVGRIIGRRGAFGGGAVRRTLRRRGLFRR